MNISVKITLLPFFLLLAVGCNQSYNFFNGKYLYSPYNGIVDHLNGEVVDIDILGFKILWIEDSVLLVSTRQDPQKLVSAYSLHDYHPLYEGLILKGRGPNEFLNVSFVSSFTDSVGIKIWLSVDYGQKLLCIDLTCSIKNQNLVIIKEIDLSQLEDLFALFRISVQCDTSIILERIYSNVHITNYNPVSKKETSIGWLYSEEIDRSNVTDIASTGFFFDAEKSFLISGMLFFNQINFFDLRYPEQSFSTSTAKKSTHYYLINQVEVGVRPQYYYGPIDGHNMLIFGYLNGKNQYGYESTENNFLHIVDWNGKTRHVFLLDRPFTGDAFDKRTGYLYGTDNETQDILKYKLQL